MGGVTRLVSLRNAAAALLFANACAPAPPPPAPVPAMAEPAPALACDRILVIEVAKRERRLRAHCEGGAVVEMPVALGRGPAGDKRTMGDARTPEGHYRISGPPRKSRFHRFLPIDYPSMADAATARAEGRLSEADYRRIAAAHGLAEPPPWDTSLGGQLGLHGEGKKWRGDSRYLDWTFGCIGLADADIDFIAARSSIGTPVVIVP